MDDIFKLDFEENISSKGEITDVDLNKYEVTNHSRERFVERVKFVNNPTEVKRYINMHGLEIKQNINKLIYYGDIVYKGALHKYENNLIVVKDQWIIIIDPDNNLVRTLWEVRLGDNKKLAKQVVKTMVKDIEKLATTYHKLEEKININIKKVQDKTYHLEIRKQMLEDELKSLEDTIKANKTIVKNAYVDLYPLRQQISDTVDDLMQRRHNN